MVLDRSFRIRGAGTLRDVGIALRDIGDGKELKRNLVRQLREAGKPAAEAMRARLAKELPDRGGVSVLLTKRKFSVRNRLTGKGAGVQIATTKKHQYRQLEDTGILRHPVFGDGDEPRSDWLWVAQSVSGAKGALGDEFDDHNTEFVRAVQDALDSTWDRVDRALRGL